MTSLPPITLNQQQQLNANNISPPTTTTIVQSKPFNPSHTQICYCNINSDCSSSTLCYTKNTSWIQQDSNNAWWLPAAMNSSTNSYSGVCGCNTKLGHSNEKLMIFPGINCARYTSNPANNFWIITSVLLLIGFIIAFTISSRALFRRLTTTALGSFRARMDDANSFALLSFCIGSIFGMCRSIIHIVTASSHSPMNNNNREMITGTDACLLYCLCFYSGSTLFVSLVWLEMAKSIQRLNPNPSVKPRRKVAAFILLSWIIVLIPTFAVNEEINNSNIAVYASIPFYVLIYVFFFVGSFQVMKLLVPPETSVMKIYWTYPKPNVEVGYYSIRRTTIGSLIVIIFELCVSVAFVSLNSSSTWAELSPPGVVSIISILEQLIMVGILLGGSIILYFLRDKLQKSIQLRKQSFLRRSSARDEEIARTGNTSPNRRVNNTTTGDLVRDNSSAGGNYYYSNTPTPAHHNNNNNNSTRDFIVYSLDDINNIFNTSPSSQKSNHGRNYQKGSSSPRVIHVSTPTATTNSATTSPTNHGFKTTIIHQQQLNVTTTTTDDEGSKSSSKKSTSNHPSSTQNNHHNNNSLILGEEDDDPLDNLEGSKGTSADYFSEEGSKVSKEFLGGGEQGSKTDDFLLLDHDDGNNNLISSSKFINVNKINTVVTSSSPVQGNGVQLPHHHHHPELNNDDQVEEQEKELTLI
jgi:hypothetical protein